MVDPISLEILRVVAKEELQSLSGVTPYRIMKKLNLYPSFAYKLVKKLESAGALKCVNSVRGKQCRLTVFGVLLLYKYDDEFRHYAEKLCAQKVALKNNSFTKTVLNLIVDKELPRSFAELLGWCILNSHIKEVSVFLREMAKCRGFSFVVTPHLVAGKIDGKAFMVCEFPCNNCNINNCKYLRSLQINLM